MLEAHAVADYSPSIPWIFNVEADPKELWNIAPANVRVGVPTTKLVVGYEKSLERYPNVPPDVDGPPAPGTKK